MTQQKKIKSCFAKLPPGDDWVIFCGILLHALLLLRKLIAIPEKSIFSHIAALSMTTAIHPLGHLEHYFFMVNLKKITMATFFKYTTLCNVIAYHIQFQ